MPLGNRELFERPALSPPTRAGKPKCAEKLRSAILLMVFRQAGRWVGLGAATGPAITVGAAEMLSAMLHAISPLDALSLAEGVAVVVTASLVACWLPAHRATRTQPMEVLRAG
jgi:putative ABC transport system permease protein